MGIIGSTMYVMPHSTAPLSSYCTTFTVFGGSLVTATGSRVLAGFTTGIAAAKHNSHVHTPISAPEMNQQPACIAYEFTATDTVSIASM